MVALLRLSATNPSPAPRLGVGLILAGCAFACGGRGTSTYIAAGGAGGSVGSGGAASGGAPKGGTSNDGGSATGGDAGASSGSGGSSTAGSAGGGGTSAGAAGESGAGGAGDCDPGWLGSACDERAMSCNALLAAAPTAESGLYIVDPDGAEGSIEPFEAHCDMTFAGGGWTLVMATGGIAPNSQVAGVVAPGSGTHMPAAKLLAVAGVGVSTQIHIRLRDAAETAAITSTADSLPIMNLRTLHVLNDNSGMYSGTDPVVNWTGPFAADTSRLWHSCGAAPFGTLTGYPNIWWSCNNLNGLHIADMFSGWGSEPAANADMEVYLR